MLIDPYTFTEWEDAMLAILSTSAVPQKLRLLIDRRGAIRPTSAFVGCMLNFFRAHEAHLAGTRAAVVVSDSAPEARPDLRVGRFRIRTFHDAAEALQWLDPDWMTTDQRRRGHARGGDREGPQAAAEAKGDARTPTKSRT